jgi:hypothetical protein
LLKITLKSRNTVRIRISPLSPPVRGAIIRPPLVQVPDADDLPTSRRYADGRRSDNQCSS